MEFVSDSSTIQQAQIDSNYDISVYLNSLSEDEEERKKIFENYMLSNAGYSVATFLLAVGDRHLENLMLSKNGKMWHLDFGFILGKNPPGKGVFVPKIRINQHMVKGLGGMESEGYEKFVDKTIEAFLHLRKHRVLIINLIALMADASIENLPKDETV